jgi:hypothetical protein
MPVAPAQVEIQYTYGHNVYTRDPSLNPNLAYWNLIGRNITAQPPVLSPSSILPPHSSHCASFTQEKFGARSVSKILFHFLFFKLRKSAIA